MQNFFCRRGRYGAVNYGYILKSDLTYLMSFHLVKYVLEEFVQCECMAVSVLHYLF